MRTKLFLSLIAVLLATTWVVKAENEVNQEDTELSEVASDPHEPDSNR